MKPVVKPQSSPVSGSDAAPMIYFDGIVAFGTRDGVVQLELAANHLVPVSIGSGEVKTKIVVTAHLRCSAGTAAAMIEILEKIVTSAPPVDPPKQ